MSEQPKKTRYELEQQYNQLQQEVINAPRDQRKAIMDKGRHPLLRNIRHTEDLKDIDPPVLASQVNEHFKSLLKEGTPTPLPLQHFEEEQRSRRGKQGDIKHKPWFSR